MDFTPLWDLGIQAADKPLCSLQLLVVTQYDPACYTQCEEGAVPPVPSPRCRDTFLRESFCLCPYFIDPDPISEKTLSLTFRHRIPSGGDDIFWLSSCVKWASGAQDPADKLLPAIILPLPQSAK